MSSPVLFVDVAQALAAGGSTVHAAEAHGWLCGALCVRAPFRVADWLEELVESRDDDDEHPDNRATLLAVHEQTTSALEGTQMEFAPLLPDDEESLADRVEALNAWCQGFLYGFGTVSPGSGPRFPADVDEVLRDFAEISRAGAVGSESEQVEEESYAELVEYVRAGTQLVYDELEPRRRAEASAVS
jgi:yecA family protein